MCNLITGHRVNRRVSCLPKATYYYKPMEVPLCDLEIIDLCVEELEAIRLCDLLCVEQDKAADMMGISRETFWNDLQKTRQKVVNAPVNGKGIKFSAGEYLNSGEFRVGFHCKGCEHSWELQHNE